MDNNPVAIGCVISVALSVGFPRPAGSGHPGPVVLGLSSACSAGGTNTRNRARWVRGSDIHHGLGSDRPSASRGYSNATTLVRLHIDVQNRRAEVDPWVIEGNRGIFCIREIS